MTKNILQQPLSKEAMQELGRKKGTPEPELRPEGYKVFL
jgi:hypothetical protein